jgi:hypothetical protein
MVKKNYDSKISLSWDGIGGEFGEQTTTQKKKVNCGHGCYDG